jgi:hypothetical protein
VKGKVSWRYAKAQIVDVEPKKIYYTECRVAMQVAVKLMWISKSVKVFFFRIFVLI